MPISSAIEGGEGEQGEPVTGSPEEEAREMLEYYRGLGDNPGEFFLPIDSPGVPDDFKETSELPHPTGRLKARA